MEIYDDNWKIVVALNVTISMLRVREREIQWMTWNEYNNNNIIKCIYLILAQCLSNPVPVDTIHPFDMNVVLIQQNIILIKIIRNRNEYYCIILSPSSSSSSLSSLLCLNSSQAYWKSHIEGNCCKKKISLNAQQLPYYYCCSTYSHIYYTWCHLKFTFIYGFDSYT